jgi:hypothetical protein
MRDAADRRQSPDHRLRIASEVEAMDWTRRGVVGAGIASCAPVATLAATAATEDAYPCWKVQSGGAKVYLMGDGGAVTTPWRSARIEQALAECGSFWREEAPGELGADAVAKLIAAGTVPTRPLSTWLTPAEQRRVRDAAERVGATYDRIAAYEPWLAAGALGVFYARHAASGSPGPSPVLNAAAVAQRKRIWTELPNADAYLELWTGFSPAAQVEQLMFVVDEIDAGPNGYARAAAAYASGDLSLEIERVASEALVYPHKYEAEVATRNRRWPARFRQMIKDGGASFVLVGADHLFGKDGVLALLARDGIPARRI